MSYTIITPRAVKKQLDALPSSIYKRMAIKIQQLAEDPWPAGALKMKGSDREYRIRVGNYRVRYEIDDQELIVLLLQCKHRKDIYKK